MLDILLLVSGILVLLLAIADILWTTLWVDGGAGPLSPRLTASTWRALRRFGERSSAVSLAGPIILAVTLAVWFGGLWLGWTLVFAGGDGSIRPAHPGLPVDVFGIVYFVGYTMFTLGNGDFYPAPGGWQLVTALVTASGMLFVTMGVSYILSVLSAVPDKRSFASTVTSFGQDGEGFVEAGWDEGDFDQFPLPLDTLSSQLSTLAHHHRSYPILHYYHSEEAKHASAAAVAILDEALTMLSFGVPAEDRPDELLLRKTRSAVEDYLETLRGAFIEPADEAPPPPDLDRLRERGIPTVGDEAFGESVGRLDERRRKLLAVVQADARRWPTDGQ